MFLPEYEISNKSLSSLINLEVNRKIVDIAPLQPEWESRLKQEALVKRIFGIFHFLENGLRSDDLAKIVKDEPERDDKASDVAIRTGVVGKERDIQQVLNFLNANRLMEQIAYLTNKFKQTDFGQTDLIKLNALLGERLVSTTELGSFRQTNVSEEGIGSAPLAVEVPYQIEDLFGWFENAGKSEIHPVLKAGTMLYELMRISPFAKNNLSTAFCFTQLILSSEGYDLKKLWSPEEETLKNRDSLMAALASVSANNGELSLWFEYFTRNLDDASEKIKTKVLNLVGDAPLFKSDKGRVISLTEREIAIMEEMTLKNEMTIKEIRNTLPMVSDDTILRDLKDLIDKKLIRKKGKTKGAVYMMGKVKSYR